MKIVHLLEYVYLTYTMVQKFVVHPLSHVSIPACNRHGTITSYLKVRGDGYIRF